MDDDAAAACSGAATPLAATSTLPAVAAAAAADDAGAWVQRASAAAAAGDVLTAYCAAHHAVAVAAARSNSAAAAAASGWRLLGDANAAMGLVDAAVDCYRKGGSDDAAAAKPPAVVVTHPLRGTLSHSPGVGRIALPTAARRCARGSGGARDPDVVCAAMRSRLSHPDAVALAVIPGKGVGVVALRALPAGAVVHTELPLIAAAAAPADPALRRCYHCLSRLQHGAGVPCTCDRVFCSAACAVDARATYHAGTCGAHGGTADAVLEAAAAADPVYGARALLVAWKLVGAALTAAGVRHGGDCAAATVCPPADLPPFCHLDRATDCAPGDDAVTTYAAAAPMALAWAAFHDVLGGSASVPPAWLPPLLALLVSNGVTLRSSEADEPPGCAVMAAGSYFNHSCAPNTRYDADLATSGAQLVFTTTAAVSAGDELTIAYLDVGTPFPARRASLRLQYGFTCTCPRCA